MEKILCIIFKSISASPVKGSLLNGLLKKENLNTLSVLFVEKVLIFIMTTFTIRASLAMIRGARILLKLLKIPLLRRFHLTLSKLLNIP
jgi:hypothetical protein